MDQLDCGYTGGKRQIIQLRGDLDRGWGKIGSVYGFDRTVFLPYDSESKFKCRLRFVAWAQTGIEAGMRFPGTVTDRPISLDANTAEIVGKTLIVQVPLSQIWTRTKLESRRPLIYSIDETFLTLQTDAGAVTYRIQLWVTFWGPPKMFVKDEYERGDGFAWVGGRTESNRSKF